VISFDALNIGLDVANPMYVDLYGPDASVGSRAIVTHASSLGAFNVTVNLSISGAGVYDTFFSVLAPGALTAVDFANVKEMRISWGGHQAQDFGLTQIIVSGAASVSCVSKTLNNSSAITIAPVTPPATTDLNVRATVRSDATSTAETPIRVLDTIGASVAGSSWQYVGPTTVTCSGPASPCPTMNAPTVTATTLEWTPTSDTQVLAPGQIMYLDYILRVTDLTAGNTKSNCVAVKKLATDTYPACTTACTSTVTATTTTKVPSMTEWGAISTFILLCLGGIYLTRRKRSSAV